MNVTRLASHVRWIPLLLGLCAGAATSVALAAPDEPARAGDAVPASTGPVYVNVHAICPQIEDQLTQVLGVSQARHRAEGLVTVSFRLSGTSIDEIQQRGGPFEYRGDVRRAVRRLTCQSDGPDRRYVLQIQFLNELPDTATASSSPAATSAAASAPVRRIAMRLE